MVPFLLWKQLVLQKYCPDLSMKRTMLQSKVSKQTTLYNMKEFVCISGLPRTGSTLLSAILSQNPKIHAEGNSAVCQLMWDIFLSCNNGAKEQLLACKREATVRDILQAIPQIYYKDVKAPIVVDKCRSWTVPINFELLRNFLNPNAKVIVLERSVLEIVQSFAKLYKDNKRELDLADMLKPQSEPIMRSIAGINWAKAHNQKNNFFFLSYNTLITNPEETMRKVYEFCGWEPFVHDFTNIVSKFVEDDSVYKLQGQHTIRSSLSRQENPVVLPDTIVKQCEMIDRLMGYTGVPPPLESPSNDSTIETTQ